jgi:hypothetical protein
MASSRPFRIMASVWITLLAMAGVLALVAMIPTRRLFRAGWSTGGLTLYFLATWLLSVFVAAGPGRSRLVLPILVLAYALPYVPVPERLRRLLGRPERRPPPKNVTPPDAW